MRVSPIHYIHEEVLPVFVYGSLMSGLGNHKLLFNRYDKLEPSTLEGFDLYPVGVGCFPGIVRGEGTVKGELYYIKPHLYPLTLLNLDSLEGYDPRYPKMGTYIREKVKVRTQEGQEVDAYVYVWNRPVVKEDRIEGGSWRDVYLDFRYRAYLKRFGGQQAKLYRKQ